LAINAFANILKFLESLLSKRGKHFAPQHSRVNKGKLHEAGFTLIELLIAIAIMAIVMGVAVLAIPNHDDRYWRDNLDQLVGSLNMAQEESLMAGMPIMVQIDSAGWRFFTPTANGSAVMMGSNTGSGQLTGSSVGLGGSSNASSNQSSLMGSNGLMPDVYRPQAWNKPVEIAALQLTLGGEQVTQAMQIPIKQQNRQAVLFRDKNGRFTWAAGAIP